MAMSSRFRTPTCQIFDSDYAGLPIVGLSFNAEEKSRGTARGSLKLTGPRRSIIHDSRRIYTDGRDFPAGMEENAQVAGYSIGCLAYGCDQPIGRQSRKRRLTPAEQRLEPGRKCEEWPLLSRHRELLPGLHRAAIPLDRTFETLCPHMLCGGIT
jgi:hypothetical protein